MQTIELTNSFHNTSIPIARHWADDAAGADMETWQYIQLRAMDGDASAKRVERRIRNTLCGMSDCHCGVVRD